MGDTLSASEWQDFKLRVLSSLEPKLEYCKYCGMVHNDYIDTCKYCGGSNKVTTGYPRGE